MRRLWIIMIIFAAVTPVYAYTNQSVDDARLMSLIVRGAQMSPRFRSDITDYTAQVSGSRITIAAMQSSGQATVTGTGDFTLTPARHTFPVVVKAKNGNTRTYTIRISTAQSAFKVTYQGKSYTLVDNLSETIFPDYFTLSSVRLNNRTVVALKHNKADLYVVVLKDANNHQGFYIVKDHKIVSPLRLLHVNGHDYVMENHQAPNHHFHKKSLKINNQTVTGYRFDDQAHQRYTLLYLLGNHQKPCFYAYEATEGTLQRYVFESSASYTGINTLLLLAAFFFGIAFVLLLFRYRSFKKQTYARFRYYQRQNKKSELH